MPDGGHLPDQAVFDAAFGGDDPYETIGQFHAVEVDAGLPSGFPELADFYVATTLAAPDEPFLSVGPRPLPVRLLSPLIRRLGLHYRLLPSAYVPPPPGVAAAVVEAFGRCLDADAVAGLVDREEARLGLEDSAFPDETVRTARELPVGVCVLRPRPDGDGTIAEFGYYGDFHAAGDGCTARPDGEGGGSTSGAGGAGETETQGSSLPPPPREFPTPPDAEYNVDDVRFNVGYYVPVDVRRDVLWYPDSLAVYLTFPDGEACRVDTNLRNLVVWYVRVADRRPGLLPAEPYYHRAVERDGEVVLDLSDWQGGSERVLGDPGPRLRGPRDEVADFVERLIADVFDALAEVGLDTREIATELSTSVPDADAGELRGRLLDLQ